MATNFDSTQYAKTQSTPHTLLQPTEMGGYVKCAWATVESTTDFDDTDTINLFTLPKNSRPVAGYVTADDEAACATIQIGTAASAAGYMAATSIENGPTYLDMVSTGGVLWLGDQVLTADTLILAKIGGADLTGSSTITVWMLYVSPA